MFFFSVYRSTDASMGSDVTELERFSQFNGHGTSQPHLVTAGGPLSNGVAVRHGGPYYVKGTTIKMIQ